MKTASAPTQLRGIDHPRWGGGATAWTSDDGSLSSGPLAITPTDGARRDAHRSHTAGSGAARRIAVRAIGRIVIVPVETIVRLEAQDNYVRIWAERTLLHKETLTALCARL